MANDDIPSIPLPPTAVVPPIESAPIGPPAATIPPPAQPNPYGHPGYAAPPAYVPMPAGPPTGLSLASMITGIGGIALLLAGFGFLPALAAVILGHLGQKRQPYARGFWLTGLITGYVGLALSLLTLVAIIFFFVIAASTGYSSYDSYDYDY